MALRSSKPKPSKQSQQNAGSNISNLISAKLRGEKLKENTRKQSGQAKCKIRKNKMNRVNTHAKNDEITTMQQRHEPQTHR